MVTIKDILGEEREVAEFYIGNRLTNSDEMLVRIPEEYVKYFDNHRFKDASDLSKALMFANCAEEARFYNNLRSLEENEESLKIYLNKAV